MMNFVFISPNFPESYKIFADRLMRNGINVLGIGDAPYEALDEELRDALTEYYKVDNMEDYDSMYRAVAYFAFRYGKIDWIESNNEYWLRQDARLREDFNVTTGVQPHELALWQSKSAMKPVYKSAGIPTARNHKVSDIAAAEAFIDEIGGYPVFCKPDTGVGAEDTFKVEDHDDLEIFFRCKPDEPYVMEEFIVGDVYTYDAICDSNGEPLFESSLKCPNIADTVNSDQETLVMILPDVHPQIREYGRKALKEFKVKSRFVHFEFFRLKEPRKGLGDVGDHLGLEVNMRPAGGMLPDMMNYAHSCDVFQIYADMVAFDERREHQNGSDRCCVFAGRKDRFEHEHSHDEILDRYGDNMISAFRMPDVFADAMGNQIYMALFDDADEAFEFGRYILEYNFDYVMTH
jgi:hypothetical protein